MIASLQLPEDAPGCGAGVVKRIWVTEAFDDWRPDAGPESSIAPGGHPSSGITLANSAFR